MRNNFTLCCIFCDEEIDDCECDIYEHEYYSIEEVQDVIEEVQDVIEEPIPPIVVGIKCRELGCQNGFVEDFGRYITCSTCGGTGKEY